MQKVNLFFIDLSQKIYAPFQNKLIKDLFFLVVLFAVFFFLQLFEGSFQFPQGIHVWRQSDGWAQIMNYYNNDLNVLDWGLSYNQFDNGARGVGEFPIHYILQAALMKITGVSFWVPQYYSAVLSLLGVFCFYKATAKILKNSWMGMISALLFFYSPLFIAYAFRMMPDAYAMATFNFGFYFLVDHYYRQKRSSYVWGIFFMCLTAIVKVFFIVPFIALWLVMIVVYLLRKEHPYKVKHLIWGVLPLATFFIWMVVAQKYNDAHHSYLFLNHFIPYWETDEATRTLIFERIREVWVYQLFNTHMLKIYGLLSILGMVFLIRTRNYLWVVFQGIFTIGLGLYFMLFFKQFYDHDYYLLPFLFFILGWLISFFYGAKKIIGTSFYPTIAFCFVVLIAALNFNSIRAQMQWRYESWRNESLGYYHLFQNREAVKDYVDGEMTFIYPDPTPNYGLSMINAPGWSAYQINSFKMDLPQMVEKGLKYVVVFQTELPEENLQYLETTPKEFGDQVRVYKVKD